MTLITDLMSHVTVTGTLIYCAIGFFFWFIFYGLYAWGNGALLGRRQLLGVLTAYWEELRWFLPGGLALRAAHVRKLVGPDSEKRGFISQYTFEEIRTQNLYEKAAKQALGSGWEFWAIHLIIPLWPILFALWVLEWMVYDISEFIKYLRSRLSH